MNVSEVNQWIMEHASKKDIDSINQALHMRWDTLNRAARYAFRVGDRVRIKSDKVVSRGLGNEGVITKINTKTIVVKVGEGSGYFDSVLWKVSAGSLEKI